MLVVALVAALGIAFAAAAAFAPDASAQGGPICSQYPDLPQCQDAPDDGGSDEGAVPPGAGDGPTGEASGELPFTGYPLTALILLLLVLLIAGLTIRAYLAVRDRVTDHNATS